ncbi:hypothetical protein ACFQX7_39540 [Luedemannella flava]
MATFQVRLVDSRLVSSSIGRGQGDDAVYGVGPYGGLRDLFSLQRVIAGLGALAVLATVPSEG